MDQRLKLQTLLELTLGSRHVYFQPPPNVQMQYPAIVYERYRQDTDYANNLPYRNAKRYEVTVIDQDPDSKIPDAVAALPTCSFSRHFPADNLNHDIFFIYF